MEPSEKIVTEIPLKNIWSFKALISATRKRYLGFDDLKTILKKGPIIFVIANVGHQLKWISVDKCFDFWKAEVKPHLVNSPHDGFSLENFPDEYAYIASEWTGDLQTSVVLLEMYH